MMVLYFSLSEIQIFFIDMRVYETRVALKPRVDNFFHREQYVLVRMNNILYERALQ